MRNIYEGCLVKSTEPYGSEEGTVTEVNGSFITIKTMDGNKSIYHESDLLVEGEDYFDNDEEDDDEQD